MDKLPVSQRTQNNRLKPTIPYFLKIILASILAWSLTGLLYLWPADNNRISSTLPINFAETLQKCRSLDTKPGPPYDFNQRSKSDRFVLGTKPTLLKNASIWTGRSNGLEVIEGDLLLDKGLIKALGVIKQDTLDSYHDIVTLDVLGSWVSPGIVDLHSHIGVDSSPTLQGARDGNSRKGLVLPWMRSLDGLNTHDDAFLLSISGGVTTSLVLPGSADAIGGQAFVIKLRPTSERSPTSMLLEPPYLSNGSKQDLYSPPHWRYMKHACGENPSRVYSGTRMDTIWAFRQGYDTARKIKESQDQYCSKALQGQWEDIGDFPEDLQWEALVDVLRGRVKVQVHCYESVDLTALVGLSNEFQFPIAAFHHAHETYLVPDLLKQAYGHPPAIALFATNARYKREAYRGSEFAPRILADNGLKVVMKSDHPVLDSRHLLYEAQQAHYYGLPSNLALAAVTSTPAQVMGQDHRIGFVQEGHDADVVLWDSHPLALGATPKQVWIDGIPQFESPYISTKPSFFQKPPNPPNFDKETANTIKYEGLPPIEPINSKDSYIVFSNISSIYMKENGGIAEIFSAYRAKSTGVAVVKDGDIVCLGAGLSCLTYIHNGRIIDLKGGSISPSLVSFGSPLGLQDIPAEPSTYDGFVLDPLTQDGPHLIRGSLIHAVDGLQFTTRDLLLAYRSGVTTGITAPKSLGFLSGLSTAFTTGSAHTLQSGAVIQDDVALHIAIKHRGIPSISSQIATLRKLLFGNVRGEIGYRFRDAAKGKIPLVVEAYSADVMASLIRVKREVEAENKNNIKLIFAGATEAHLLAEEIAEANIGVVVTPSRPFPSTWESRRILPGPPLTKDSAISLLLAHNITVGIGIEEQWSARSIRFDIAWAALEANGNISKTEALALASVNLEKIMGLRSTEDLVATAGGDLLQFESKVVAVISKRRGLTDLF